MPHACALTPSPHPLPVLAEQVHALASDGESRLISGADDGMTSFWSVVPDSNVRFAVADTPKAKRQT